MYAEDDPLLVALRPVALSFPEAVEKESWGRPTFRAGKIFATYGVTEDCPHLLVFKPDVDEREALLQDPRVVVPPYFGPGGWLGLDLAAAPPDWDEVRELLDASYRQVALRRMVRALDARSLPA
jgi:hypothetical protein